MLTPETLTRHELVGLPVRVADATSPDYVGLAGRVVGESMRTLTVRTDSGDKRVPKGGATFEFELVEPSAVTSSTVRSESTDESGVRAPSSDECGGDPMPPYTDEAAGSDRATLDGALGTAQRGRKAPGSASELGSETAGVRPRQSGPSGNDAERGTLPASQRGECEGVVYVTVDGTKLLSRPAERTERGVETWR